MKPDRGISWPIETAWAMRMSPDGKYLYTYDSALRKYRLDGEDLIREEDGRELDLYHAPPPTLDVNQDGTLIVTPGWLFKWNDLSEPFVTFTRGSSAAFDPKSGRIYVVSHRELEILDQTGVALKKIPKEHSYRKPIAVHPEGDRLVTWASSGFLYFDLRQELP
jgi:hypothetical protein